MLADLHLRAIGRLEQEVAAVDAEVFLVELKAAAIDLVAESAKPIPKEQAEAREKIWTPEKGEESGEGLTERLYALNRRLMTVEGRLLRTPEQFGVALHDFLRQYYTHELDPNWLRRVSRLKAKGWGPFASKKATVVTRVRSGAGGLTVLVALYRYYFYQHRLTDADAVDEPAGGRHHRVRRTEPRHAGAGTVPEQPPWVGDQTGDEDDAAHPTEPVSERPGARGAPPAASCCRRRGARARRSAGPRGRRGHRARRPPSSGEPARAAARASW